MMLSASYDGYHINRERYITYLLPHTYDMATQDANKWRAGTLMRKTRKNVNYFGRRDAYYI